MRETYEAFAAAQPELLKSIIGRVEKDPLCTGVVPTVAAARDPSQCKYTVEGTLVHDIMTNVKLLERREASAYDGLEYKLTEAEKKSIITNSVAFLSSQNTKATHARTGRALHPPLPLPPQPTPPPSLLRCLPASKSRCQRRRSRSWRRRWRRAWRRCAAATDTPKIPLSHATHPTHAPHLSLARRNQAVASVKPSDLPDSMPFKDVLKMH